MKADGFFIILSLAVVIVFLTKFICNFWELYLHLRLYLREIETPAAAPVPPKLEDSNVGEAPSFGMIMLKKGVELATISAREKPGTSTLFVLGAIGYEEKRLTGEQHAEMLQKTLSSARRQKSEQGGFKKSGDGS